MLFANHETMLILARDRQIELRQAAAQCRAGGTAVQRLIARLLSSGGRPRPAGLDALGEEV